MKCTSPTSQLCTQVSLWPSAHAVTRRPSVVKEFVWAQSHHSAEFTPLVVNPLPSEGSCPGWVREWECEGPSQEHALGHQNQMCWRRRCWAAARGPNQYLFSYKCNESIIGFQETVNKINSCKRRLQNIQQ